MTEASGVEESKPEDCWVDDRVELTEEEIARKDVNNEISRELEYADKLIEIPTVNVDSKPKSKSRKHLTAQDAVAIRAALVNGESQSSLARRYGVSQPAIHYIAKGKSHKVVAENSEATKVITSP